jgi:glycosyltransferase involved in cell wall biosynthesis
MSQWMIVGASLTALPTAVRALLRLRGIACTTDRDSEAIAGIVSDDHAWVCFLAAGDRLAANAAQRISATVNGATSGSEGSSGCVDVIYGDTRHLVRHADRLPTFQRRPGFSPERLRHHDYIGPMIAVRAAHLRMVGDVAELARCDSHDRNLRLTERAARVVRIAHVLYETPEPSLAPAASRDAVVRHLARMGIDADVTVDDLSPAVQVRRRVSAKPLVSVLIPTRGSSATIFGRQRTLVVDAVRSVLTASTYPNVEFIVVADTDTPDVVRAELRAVGGDRLRIVDFDRPFNFAEKINLAAAHAKGDYFLLLNDDTQVISPDFLDALVSLVSDDGVGLVGPTLSFEDGTIQSAGHVFSPEPTDLYRGAPADARGAHDMLRVTRETSSIIAACALTSRTTFESVGGLSVQFPGNWNDIDYGLKVWQSGRRVLVTPLARLYHFESKTRVPVLVESEVAKLGHRWGHVLDDDPFFNPHLQRYVNVWKTDSTSPRSYSEALGPTAPIASK